MAYKNKEDEKAWHEAHKEEKKAYNKIYHKAWNKANPEKARVQKARRRAKKAGTVCIPTRPNFKAFLIEVWNNKCAYCKNTSDKLEVDHFMPIDLKGHDAEYNLVLACRPCNRSKGAKAPHVWLDEKKIFFTYPDYMMSNSVT